MEPVVVRLSTEQREHSGVTLAGQVRRYAGDARVWDGAAGPAAVAPTG